MEAADSMADFMEVAVTAVNCYEFVGGSLKAGFLPDKSLVFFSQSNTVGMEHCSPL
jgi:hypothetical protein